MYFDILNSVNLKSKNELLAVCKSVEENARTYPDMCVINIRKALEILTRSILSEKGYIFPKNTRAEEHKLYKMINLCSENDSRVTKDAISQLHELRDKANKIVHVDYKQEGDNRYKIKDKHATVEVACEMTINLYEIIAKIFGLSKRDINDYTLPIGDYQIVEVLKKNELEGIAGDYKYIGKKNEMGVDQYAYIRPFAKSAKDDKTYLERDASALLRIKSDKFKCKHVVAGNIMKVGAECSYIYVTYDINEDTFTLDNQNKKFECKEVLNIALDLTQGLLELKKIKNKINHRSVRPEYVFITPMNDGSYEASLGCFETAKIESKEVPIETVMPQMLRTQKSNYFAPSEIRNKSIEELQDTEWEKVDVYSLMAIIAYCIDRKAIRETINLDVFYDCFSSEFTDFAESVFYNAIKLKPSLEELEEKLEKEVNNV